MVVNMLDKIYETGRKVAKGFKETMKIIFDEYLPKWNYRVVPTIWQTLKLLNFHL